MADQSCKSLGYHRYYVPEVIGVEKEGKVFVILVCTACGETYCREFPVAKGPTEIRLSSQEKRNKD